MLIMAPVLMVVLPGVRFCCQDDRGGGDRRAEPDQLRREGGGRF